MPNVTTEETGFIYTYQNYVKRAFVQALRTAFANSATPIIYKYDSNQNLSQIDIRVDYPERISKLPCIITTIGSGVADVTYLGDEFAREVYVGDNYDGTVFDKAGYLYSGKLTLNVDINVIAGKQKDIEHISDIVIMYVRYLFRNTFSEHNIVYTKIGNGGIRIDNGDFVNKINVPVTCSFTHFIPKELYNIITNIDFDILATLEF